MDWSGCEFVEVIPGKVSGVPLLKGTRVPADQVVENYESGETIGDIAYHFDLKTDLIRGVLAFGAGCQPVLRP